MQEGCQDEEWSVDRRQNVGKPLRKEDVGDRTMFSSEGFGKQGEGAVESVRREDQALGADHIRR